MNLSALQAKLPDVCSWIDGVLQQHRHMARPVTSFGFTRLPHYFKSETLSRASVAVVDVLPMPPLSALGLHQFDAFERMDADGITYKNVYFLKRERAMDESLHFHELVHTVQWQLLGAEPFIFCYARGLAQHEYSNNPFEQVAYALEDRFCLQGAPFNVEPIVEDHLARTVPALLSSTAT